MRNEGKRRCNANGQRPGNHSFNGNFRRNQHEMCLLAGTSFQTRPQVDWSSTSVRTDHIGRTGHSGMHAGYKLKLASFKGSAYHHKAVGEHTSKPAQPTISSALPVLSQLLISASITCQERPPVTSLRAPLHAVNPQRNLQTN